MGSETASDEDHSSTGSQIAAFFRGCNVFITGATGFMGKVLVEKLLRSCPDIKTIYLLMRPKNGFKLDDRLQEFKTNVIFDRIREEGPIGMLDKLVAVNGDVTQMRLGLSKPDTCMLVSKVNVVFHCAATVRFDDTDRQTFLLNTRGTQELTTLALQMQHLQALVLVSTAFSNADRSFIDEVVYPAHEDYNYVIKCAEKLEDHELSRLTTEMMKDLPNTYVFSKSLGENILYDQKGKLPAAIFRPSLVCPAYEEPMPGWVDSKNGPMGVLIGASTGLLRTMRGDGNKKTDLVPVDFSINAMIVVAWHIATTKRLDIPVYNCTTSSEVDVTWNGFLDLGIQEYDKCPLLQVFWYPGGAIHCSKLMHLICFFIKQLIPAMVLDAVLLISCKKPMFFKLQTGIYSKLNTIEYFVSNEWTFKNSNFRSLLKHMVPEDRRIFNFDVKKIVWKEYIRRWLLGTRRFIVKLDDSNIPEARTKLRRLFWLNQVIQFTFYGCMTWILTPYFVQSLSGIRSMYAVTNMQTSL